MSTNFLQPTKLFDIAERRFLITGSGSGIGLGLAQGIGAAGGKIVLNGRDVHKLEVAENKLRKSGIHVETAAFDVSDPDTIESNIKKIEAEIGPIDVLINNAGTNRRGRMADISANDYQTVIQANIDGLFLTTRAVAPYMQDRKAGKIINICSALSKLGRKGAVAYSGSKAAAAMMTASMCDELAADNIQVNGIAPGYFLTEITQVIKDDPVHNEWLMKRTPAERWGQLEDLVGAAIFLSSDASNFVNGHILYVDGGLTAVMGG
ncbi:SDR family NAD(P)-dependent oxidoreductase [Yoonia sp. SS1-5]|uniref:SDR family NAD(P)-dependent oxidoreductase n=1 Tax=Yoonia rhodophyticola TaxID=3137370 RepID=A0AAN0M5R2_9RHOB